GDSHHVPYGNLLDMHLFQYYCPSPLVNAVYRFRQWKGPKRMNRVSTAREKDKAVIMATVRRFGPISQFGIHDLTRIRPATISPLVRELLATGKLNVVGHADNPMGRKQVMLRINEESGYVVALDFDEEFVDVALLDLHPRERRSLREPTNLSSGID